MWQDSLSAEGRGPQGSEVHWRVGPGGAGLCSGGYWDAQLLLPTFRPYRFEGTGWLPISELRSARPGEYLVERPPGDACVGGPVPPR